MADLSWISALNEQSGGGSGGGVSDYDQLTNRPVINIEGTGIVIQSLPTGVYNIKGTWKITEDDTERETLDDDLFYVSNDENGTRLTWISAGQIKTFHTSADGAANDIAEGDVATTADIMDDLIGSF